MNFGCNQGRNATLTPSAARSHPTKAGARIACNARAVTKNAGISEYTCPAIEAKGRVKATARIAPALALGANPARVMSDHISLRLATVRRASITTTPARPPAANHGAAKIGKPGEWIGYQCFPSTITCGSLI